MEPRFWKTMHYDNPTMGLLYVNFTTISGYSVQSFIHDLFDITCFWHAPSILFCQMILLKGGNKYDLQNSFGNKGTTYFDRYKHSNHSLYPK